MPFPNGKVCRSILLVEFISEWRGGGCCPAGPEWFYSVSCFRLSLSPGNSKVIVTKVSRFNTSEVHYAVSSRPFISDHSGKYYAMCSKIAALLQIWDIKTGQMVREIPRAEFPKILRVMRVMVIAKQGPDGPQQVVVGGGNPPSQPWAQEWDYAADASVTDFAVFPIEAGSPGWTGSSRNVKSKVNRAAYLAKPPSQWTFSRFPAVQPAYPLSTPPTPQDTWARRYVSGTGTGMRTRKMSTLSTRASQPTVPLLSRQMCH